jgi:hypothetical protein
MQAPLEDNGEYEQDDDFSPEKPTIVDESGDADSLPKIIGKR